MQHKNRLDVEGPELISLATEPKFAIGQRALTCAPAGATCSGIASA